MCKFKQLILLLRLNTPLENNLKSIKGAKYQLIMRWIIYSCSIIKVFRSKNECTVGAVSPTSASLIQKGFPVRKTLFASVG